MLDDNQRFRRAGSRIIFVKVLPDHCHIGGPFPPIREAVSHGIKIQICFASCLSGETMKKGIIFNFMDHKAFILQLEVFEIKVVRNKKIEIFLSSLFDRIL